MIRSGFAKSVQQRGAALILVLSMMALMAVVCVAFLVSSSKQVSISNQSSSLIQGTEAAEIALNQVLQDFRQEIRAGSVLPAPGRVSPELTAPVLYPAAPRSAVPDRTTAQGTDVPAGSTVPNLVKQSRSNAKFYNDTLTDVYPRAESYRVGMRASALSSSAPNVSSSVSESKWNKPLLLPRAKKESVTDFTPLAAGEAPFQGSDSVPWTWKAPDWIFLQKDGSTNGDIASKLSEATVNGSNPVMARYAYQVYDEGGLLDMNVAGYDPNMKTGSGASLDLTASRRGSLGFAELREVGFTQPMLEKLIAIRNPATLKEADVAPHNNRYANFLLNGRLNLGFMRVAGSQDPTVGLSNSAIPSRLALIDLVKKLGADDSEKAQLLNSLEFLGHYSRGLEQPSYRPGYLDPSGTDPNVATFNMPHIVPPAGPVDDRIYPIGTATKPLKAGAEGPFIVEDSNNPAGSGKILYNPSNIWSQSSVRKLDLPYVWSIGNNRGGNDHWGKVIDRQPTQQDQRTFQDLVNPGMLEIRIQPGVDPRRRRLDKTAFTPGEPLIKKRFPLERLAWLTHKGPSKSLAKSDPLYNENGTEDAIFDAFGLSWDSAGQFWVYDHGLKHHGYLTGDHGNPGKIYRLEEIAVNDVSKGFPREPDFFEILKASIAAGSLGKSAVGRMNDPGDEAGPVEVTHYNHLKDRRLDFQIFDIGVNIVDQYDADSYPTILKVPVPDASVADYASTTSVFGGGSVPSSLTPPLYVARGVENLPYIYRFHWRGILNDSYPAVPSLANRPFEVTTTLGGYDNFSPGVISLVGFPEIWNPHAPPAVSGNDGPKQLRVVAVSEAPEALIDPLLYTLPRSIPTGNKSAANFLKNGRLEFSIRPIGNFVYTPSWNGSTKDKNSGVSVQWLGYAESARDYPGYSTASGRYGIPMYWNPWTMSYQWSYEFSSDRVSSLIQSYPVQGVNQSVVTLNGLFWDKGPSADNTDNLKSLGAASQTVRANQFFNAIIPITGFIPGATSGTKLMNVTAVPPTPIPPGYAHPDLTYSDYGGPAMQPLAPPANWSSVGFNNGTVLSSRVGLGPCLPYRMYSATNLWPSNSGYATPPYPYSPDPDRILVAGNFSIDHLPGAAPLIRAKPFQNHVFVLTDSNNPRDVLQHSESSYNKAPGQSVPNVTAAPYPNGNWGGDMHNDRIIDRRGTEVTFSLASTQLFREPTTLCQPGQPQGSALALGSGNFFSANGGAPSNGGRQWVGFSLGELPAQTLILSKTFMTIKKGALVDDDYPAKGVNVWASQEEIPLDVLTVNTPGNEGSVVRVSSACGSTLTPLEPRGRGWDSAGGGSGSNLGLTTGGMPTAPAPLFGYYDGTAFPAQGGTLGLFTAFPVTPRVNGTSIGAGLASRPLVAPTTLYTQNSLGTVNNVNPDPTIIATANSFYPLNTSGEPTIFTGVGGTWPTAAGYRVRYFIMPTNLAGLKRAQLTVKLQYLGTGQKWVTYDERYIRILDWANGRGSSSPVIGCKEVIISANGSPANGSSTPYVTGPTTPYAGGATVTTDPIPWGTPLVGSYDPRTSRFGSPSRNGYNAVSAALGTRANYVQLFAPSVMNESGLPLGTGVTNRATSVLYDGAGVENMPANVVSTDKPKTIVAANDTPGSFWNWFLYNGNKDVPVTYKAMTGDYTGIDEDKPKYWEMAPDSWFGPNKLRWVQPPTLNANDFGWFPRYSSYLRPEGPLSTLLVTPPANTNTTGGVIGRKWTMGPDLPNFFQHPISTVGSDYTSALPAGSALRPDGNWNSNYGNANGKPPIADTLRLGAFSQNVAPSINNPYAQAYADPDDVIRRASGAYAVGDSGKDYTGGIDGLSEGQSNVGEDLTSSSRNVTLPASAGNRPVILDRPFRSVAELGYVFRGAPWKNLDFFTPETGDAALLDVFCLTEPPPIAPVEILTDDASPSAPPLVAGKLNLNTRQEPVLRALLAGALKDELKANVGASAGTAISSDDASNAAKALIWRTTGDKAYNGPLTNVSELAGKLLGKDMKGFTSSDPVYTSTTYLTPSPSFTGTEKRNKDIDQGKNSVSWHFSGYSADLSQGVFTDPKDWKNKRRREAVMRALADAGQTRVWNLLIDLIVQTGRFPTGSNDLTRFAKEGETRVWLHVSIDRFTGEILDKQMEWVPE
ncbi:MAG: hypothetical protein WCO60_12505 [Verrucomicrobiota bacterium]